MTLRVPAWAAASLIAILILAAVLRFWHLGDLPPGLYHDEAYNGLDALSLLDGKVFPQYYEGWELYAADAHAGSPPNETRFPVFFEGNYGREPLHVYLMAVAIALAGATPAAVRSVPAAAGVIAVLATFLATLSLFAEKDRPIMMYVRALLAAFSMAVLYPALHFSRFGVRAMLFPPLAALAIAAFWQGWRLSSRRSTFWMILAGSITGLGLYTYASARLFPLVFALFLLWAVWQDRAALRTRWQQLVLLFVSAGLVAAPLLVFFARYPYFFLFRIGYVANQGAGTVPDAPVLTWLGNIGRVMSGLVYKGETHLRHNLPGRPYTDLIQAVLLAAGLLVSIRKWLRAEYVLLLIWFAVMLLPSILSGDAPHFGRLTGAAPPIAILIAVGATVIIDFLPSKSRWPLPMAGLLAMLLFLPSLFLTTRDYFGRYASHPQLAEDFYLAEWELGQFAATADPSTALYLTPTQEEMATIYFALEDPLRLRSFTDEESLLPLGRPGDAAWYLIRPDSAETDGRLQDVFPSGMSDRVNATADSFIVPDAGDRQQPTNPSGARFAAAIELGGWTTDCNSLQCEVLLQWRALTELDRDYTAFVHILDQHGALIAQEDRPPAGYPTGDWQPGEIVIDRFNLTLPADFNPQSAQVTTGFYYLPTLERLGEPAVIGLDSPDN